ncbi:glutamate-5-semialdehyde dehydrogenase [Alicyclobacillus acidiphilus]|uniref:glutamate-5-semialdehyde dehydrogenase n=1 Tax=Alicyclobacillus acidiphilus TaxID=182455 RepID=UPI000A54A69F|nr:glutamate-5-semialdehyde dehydrogenase [Alicyclobacillus acidiphilus]
MSSDHVMAPTAGQHAAIREAVLRDLRRSRGCKNQMALAATSQKNEALQRMAESLWTHRAGILDANRADIEAARQAGQTDAKLDRLRLDERRIQDMMIGLHELVLLRDPIGEEIESTERPNGLDIRKVRVPMGVIAMIYESRPNVTVDAAGLTVKTGNTAVLRGGREALRTNRALVAALHDGLAAAGLPRDAVVLIEEVAHESVDVIITARGLVDLVIPRGGAALIRRVVEGAQVPVIETGVGNCHVYVDRAADLAKAARIIVNAKTQRPSVCNAAETLLVHRDIADVWLPDIVPHLQELSVEIRACARTLDILRSGGLDGGVRAATEDDWSTEYSDLILAVKVVDSLSEAMQHIDTYGTFHSEVIVTEDDATAEAFLQQVDAAVVYHNASSRFTDGFEFGFGAEIGISTQKLHARGPMGLREITSYKYIVHGHGQIRG